ncbi:MAG: Nicotinate phosphoribosyltransferase [Pseudolabrys sp.]|jgi:nicotinate phosphoribosyltransferase|nr:Nicotinate phosphoribosyltransferase [Pseudolabrys sp.]
MAISRPLASPLSTDLYELNMVQAYLDLGETGDATFEFFVRKLPERRGFLMAAGLETALTYLETLRFDNDDIAWLKSTGRFRPNLIDYLAGFRFSGDVHAMPEGTVFFPNEPILRVTAPLPQAQLVESLIINIMHFQTLIASKAVRMVLAANGKALADFGLRSAHGAEAGLLSARASYIAGFGGAANVEAARHFGIPAVGTMAHSFVQIHDNEATAFEHYARARPDGVTLLIDTFDTEAGARKVVELTPKLKRDGIAIRAVRIDSGDLVAMARKVRGILDAGGLKDTTIVVSGGVDEDFIATALGAGAPIDAFGVGASLDASSDVPVLECAYKLQEYRGKPRRKLSEGKVTWPGRKQVWRDTAADGTMRGDVLTIDGDAQPGVPLIAPVMKAGARVGGAPSLADIRARAAEQLKRLPDRLQRLEPNAPYPVAISAALEDLARTTGR